MILCFTANFKQRSTYFKLSNLLLFLVAARYTKTPSLLLFDLATSVPFSYYDYIVYEASSALASCSLCIQCHFRVQTA